jgi:hypothetical protein
VSEPRKPRRILRRIGAVLAGLVVIGILDTGIGVLATWSKGTGVWA